LKSGLQRRLRPHSGLNARLENIVRIRSEIENVAFAAVPQAADGLAPHLQADLLHVISKLNPTSILAMGTKTAWYSRLAIELNAKVVVFDKDSGYVGHLYGEARDRNLHVLPLVMDFTDLTPSRGLSSHVSIAAADRFQCDLVLAIGLLNPLIVERNLRFDQIAEGLSQFSTRHLIVDYSPIERLQQFDYSPEDLMRSLLKRFRSVSTLKTDSNRHGVLLCEK